VSALYRLGLIAASVGGALLAMGGAWLLSEGAAATVGRALVYGGLVLTLAAAGATVIDVRAR
jgi:hypothetical protein